MNENPTGRKIISFEWAKLAERTVCGDNQTLTTTKEPLTLSDGDVIEVISKSKELKVTDSTDDLYIFIKVNGKGPHMVKAWDLTQVTID